MKVYVSSLTGVSDGAGIRGACGDTLDIPDELAESWLRAGHVIPAKEAPPAPEPKAGVVEAQRDAERRAPRKATGRHSRRS